MPDLCLYIHIPFCLQKCFYCDFAVTAWKNEDSAQKYIQALQKELAVRGRGLQNRKIKTVYLGGGTPSLLEPFLFEQLFSTLKNHFTVFSPEEVTIEVNPGTLTKNKLKEYLKIGINRFSLGVQTFSDASLKNCGRKHSVQDTKNTLKLLSDQGLNFSADLLFSLPHQKLTCVKKDLNGILAYSPSHISTYCLTLPPSHFLQKNRPCEDSQIKMFEWVENKLYKKGFLQYEISNFAKNGFLSQHNMAYWRDKEFWGLGVGAHSYLKEDTYGVRFWNSRNMNTYTAQLETDLCDLPFSKLPQNQKEFLTVEQSLSDFCITSLRMNQGLIKNLARKKFGSKVLPQIHSRISKFIHEGFVADSRAAWALTFRGRMLSNQIFSALIF